MYQLAPGFGRADGARTLDDFLAFFDAGPHAVWETDDCGEGAGSPDVGRPPPPTCVTLYVDLPGGPRFMVTILAPSGTGTARLRGVWRDAGTGWEVLEGQMGQLQTLLLTGSGRSTGDATRPSAVADVSLPERLRELLLAEVDTLAGYEIASMETHVRPNGVGVSLLYYEDPAAGTHGQAIVLWREADGAMSALWIRLLPWTAPHALHWNDFDGDGREDLFFTAGFEDAEITALFLDRLSEEGGTPRAMLSVFTDLHDYATVVDIDQDGRPELIDPLGLDDVYGETPDCMLSPEGRQEEDEVYRAITGSFASLNRYETLYPLRPVRILRFDRSGAGTAYSMTDVTDEYPDHLRRRMRLWELTQPWRGSSCDARLAVLREWVGGLGVGDG
jgi:hypothetical protein